MVANSDPEVDSRPALRYAARVLEKCAQLMLELRFFARAGVDITFTSPLYLTVMCSPSGRYRKRVFWALDDSQL